MPFVEANGERIGYTVEGSGPPVLLIHSMGADRHMWRDQVDALADRYTCITPDCRGHGESSYAARFTVAGVAADHKAVIDALEIESCHVVGLAMGVPIALSFAAQWPEAVRALVLADGFVDMRDVGGARIPGWAKAISDTSMEEFGRNYAKSRLMPSASEAARAALSTAIAKVGPDAYIDVMRAIFEIEFTKELSTVRAPTLVIYGDQDQVTPLKHSRQIAEAVPGAKLRIIPDAGHIANLDQPAAFNVALTEYLDALPR